MNSTVYIDSNDLQGLPKVFWQYYLTEIRSDGFNPDNKYMLKKLLLEIDKAAIRLYDYNFKGHFILHLDQQYQNLANFTGRTLRETIILINSSVEKANDRKIDELNTHEMMLEAMLGSYYLQKIVFPVEEAHKKRRHYRRRKKSAKTADTEIKSDKEKDTTK